MVKCLHHRHWQVLKVRYSLIPRMIIKQLIAFNQHYWKRFKAPKLIFWFFTPAIFKSCLNAEVPINLGKIERAFYKNAFLSFYFLLNLPSHFTLTTQNRHSHIFNAERRLICVSLRIILCFLMPVFIPSHPTVLSFSFKLHGSAFLCDEKR